MSSSIREGRSSGMFETMAEVLQGVMTAVRSSQDTLADGAGGIVAPPKDSAALADGIQRLPDNAEQPSASGPAACERGILDCRINGLVSTCRRLDASVLQAKRAGAAA